MKNKKRLALTLVCCMLCTVIGFAALAEGALLTIWNAGMDLLFNTSNVSLTGYATFTYDGVLFKTFDGRYIQDDTRSYLQAMFDTPKDDGSIYTGGYTVIADNGNTYSIETNSPKVYRPNTTSLEPTVLTNTVMRSSVTRFGGLLVDLMEGVMNDAITQTEKEGGTQYAIRFADGEAPEIAGAALTLLTQIAAKEYLNINPDELTWLLDKRPVGVEVYNEDWDALFAAEYEKTFRDPMPENFYELLWDENGNATNMKARYQMILDQIDQIYNDLKAQYKQGVVLIKADGSVVHYETRDQYIVDKQLQELWYEDYNAPFRAYYEQVTGTPLSQSELQAIYRSTNAALNQAYNDMRAQMEAELTAAAREQGASAVLLHADGSHTMIFDFIAMQRAYTFNDMTPTRRILYSLQGMKLGETDVTVSLDKEGRISSASGRVTLLITDLLNIEHDLVVEFSGTAGAYGESEVQPFDPDDFDVVSINEFYGTSINDLDDSDITDLRTNALENEPDSAPETIVFNGVEYNLHDAAEDDGNG